MTDRPTVLERAFALARSGEHSGVGDIRKQLAAEGFTNLNAQLYGGSLTRQLQALCRAAQAAKP
jgi:hypothetical protein